MYDYEIIFPYEIIGTYIGNYQYNRFKRSTAPLGLNQFYFRHQRILFKGLSDKSEQTFL